MRRQHLRNKALTIFENLLLIYAAPWDRKIKFLKIPMLLLRRINIWVVTYLDDILIMGQMMEKIIQRQCNIPPPAYGFCFKLEMSIMNPVQEIDWIPWHNNKFFEDVSVFTIGKGLKIHESVSRYSCQRPDDSSRTNEIVSSSCFNNSGSFDSSDEFLISSAATNKRI